MDIDIDTTVDEIMRRWPATIRVFIDFRVNCVGCPIAEFHTVDDSCREHGVEPERFLAALRRQATLSTNTAQEFYVARRLSLRRA